jgi:hypothetical protein
VPANVAGKWRFLPSGWAPTTDGQLGGGVDRITSCIFQPDAYGGYGKPYEPGRTPGPILEAACWVHARRPLFVTADLADNARRKGSGQEAGRDLAAGAGIVRRIDALFETERTINGQGAERRKAVRRNSVRRWSPTWKPGCVSNAPSSHVATTRQGDGLHAQALELISLSWPLRGHHRMLTVPPTIGGQLLHWWRFPAGFSVHPFPACARPGIAALGTE